jgi:hypothetical protein
VLIQARHARPRGFTGWRPRRPTLAVLENVSSVLDEYRQFLPLTIRQVFYRLVGGYGFEKSERAYERLINYLNRARRARMIEFEAIRHDGFHQTEWLGWPYIEDAKQAIRDMAARYRLNRQSGQPKWLVVWCEAQGMAPQLERVCKPYSVPVYSSGGFDSVTLKYRAAQEFVRRGKVRVLHIGDHDPSGVHVFGSLGEDVCAFAEKGRENVEFIRLAVTPEHIEAYGLPTAPPKPSDRRAFEGETVQAEALPPDVLSSILQQAITDNLDQATYQDALEQERAERAALVDWPGDRQ